MPPPLPPSGQSGPFSGQPAAPQRLDPPSATRRGPLPTLPEPQSRREGTLIWVQTILLGLITAGILVMYHKVVDPKKMSDLVAPLFANLFGATVLVGLFQLVRGKAWPWFVVGMTILAIAFGGLQLTLYVVSHLGIKPA